MSTDVEVLREIREELRRANDARDRMFGEVSALLAHLRAPEIPPGPCPSRLPIRNLSTDMHPRFFDCDLRAGHAGLHEHVSSEGQARWPDELAVR